MAWREREQALFCTFFALVKNLPSSFRMSWFSKELEVCISNLPGDLINRDHISYALLKLVYLLEAYM